MVVSWLDWWFGICIVNFSFGCLCLVGFPVAACVVYCCYCCLWVAAACRLCLMLALRLVGFVWFVLYRCSVCLF